LFLSSQGSGALDPTFVIDSDHPDIVAKARELTEGLPTTSERARRLFYFVRDEITYNFAPVVRGKHDMVASRTLARGDGFCIQKAILLAALGRASHIPTRICFQAIRIHKLREEFVNLLGGSNIFPHHGLNAFYLEGRWIRLDATLDLALVTRKNYLPVEFSASSDALLPPTDRLGLPHFDIVHEHGCFNDLPEDLWNTIWADMNAVDQEAWRALVLKTDASM
jgi:transglutaminase-like putative cysteine protease